MAAMQPKAAWKTYLMVTLAMFPTLLTWLFWVTIIAPKISHQWDKLATGSSFEEMSKAVLVMAYWSNRVCAMAGPLFLAVVAALVTVEFALKKWWPRWRLTALSALVILINALLLFTFCLSSVVSLVLVDIARNGVESAEQKMGRRN
jgi:hypothetical protein